MFINLIESRHYQFNRRKLKYFFITALSWIMALSINIFFNFWTANMKFVECDVQLISMINPSPPPPPPMPQNKIYLPDCDPSDKPDGAPLIPKNTPIEDDEELPYYSGKFNCPTLPENTAVELADLDDSRDNDRGCCVCFIGSVSDCVVCGGSFWLGPTASPAQPPPPPDNKPMPAITRYGDRIIRSSLIERSIPNYPILAKEFHIEGDVKIEIIIDKDGNVSQARIISGPILLRKAAISEVMKWKFTPLLVDNTCIGAPSLDYYTRVESQSFVIFRFSLSQSH